METSERAYYINRLCRTAQLLGRAKTAMIAAVHSIRSNRPSQHSARLLEKLIAEIDETFKEKTKE